MKLVCVLGGNPEILDPLKLPICRYFQEIRKEIFRKEKKKKRHSNK